MSVAVTQVAQLDQLENSNSTLVSVYWDTETELGGKGYVLLYNCSVVVVGERGGGAVLFVVLFVLFCLFVCFWLKQN